MTLPSPETLLADITADIQALLKPNTALIGIHSGGVWLMQRILQSLQLNTLPFGTLDAAMYRDDYAQRGLKNEPKPSNIPFEIGRAHV